MNESGVGVPVQIAVTVDCNDLDAQFAFWTEFLGLKGEIHEPFGFIPAPENRTGAIWLQRVPEKPMGKNRLHLDFVVDDLSAAERRVESLGGSVEEMHSWQDFTWRTCADPEGNLFDVMQSQPAE